VNLFFRIFWISGVPSSLAFPVPWWLSSFFGDLLKSYLEDSPSPPPSSRPFGFLEMEIFLAFFTFFFRFFFFPSPGCFIGCCGRFLSSSFPPHFFLLHHLPTDLGASLTTILLPGPNLLHVSLPLLHQLSHERLFPPPSIFFFSGNKADFCHMPRLDHSLQFLTFLVRFFRLLPLLNFLFSTVDSLPES